MTVITLTTDFGSNDYGAGVLKGVIWKIAPTVQIADLTHDIPRHDVLDAALTLWRAAPFFPPGTIHIAVVDPGVGTSRRAIAAHLGSQFFVGPDNGLLTLLLLHAEQEHQPTGFIHLDQSQYWLPDISSIFHGRDVFSPVAAHLAAGVPFNLLGTPINDPIRLEIPVSTPTKNGWLGQVIHIDHFGNLGTNLYAHQLQSKGQLVIKLKGRQISGLVATFGERPAGTLIALLDSSGELAVSVVNGSASQLLGVSVGDQIEVIFGG